MEQLFLLLQIWSEQEPRICIRETDDVGIRYSWRNTPGTFYCEPDTEFVEPESWAHLFAAVNEAAIEKGFLPVYEYYPEGWENVMDGVLYNTGIKELPLSALDAYLKALERKLNYTKAPEPEAEVAK